MVNLNLFVDLPKVREAFDARTLQMFHMSASDPCTYVGPCAVGVCMDPDTRVSIPNIPVRNNRWIVVPPDQESDWSNLQLLHDLGNVANFSEFLEELESRYAQP
jgi:hypothetical protein